MNWEIPAESLTILRSTAGLALGSFLFGRFVDTRRKALPIYAILEAGIAITALLFPLFLDLLTPAYHWLQRGLQGSYLLFPLSRFFLCFVGLLIPTTLMGGTLPVITRFFVKERRAFGGNVGILYALNTFGAMVGCFCAGFFLIPGLGISGVIWLGVVLNLIAALGTILVARGEQEGGAHLAEPETEISTTCPGERPKPQVSKRRSQETQAELASHHIRTSDELVYKCR